MRQFRCHILAGPITHSVNCTHAKRKKILKFGSDSARRRNILRVYDTFNLAAVHRANKLISISICSSWSEFRSNFISFSISHMAIPFLVLTQHMCAHHFCLRPVQQFFMAHEKELTLSEAHTISLETNYRLLHTQK